MFSALVDRFFGAKPKPAPIELSGTVGGVLMHYRSEIGELAKWARSMGQNGVKARPCDTEAECWAAIGLVTGKLAGPKGERLNNMLDPEQVVTIMPSHFALAMAVFKSLSDPFIDRGHVDRSAYADELLSSLRGFAEGATVLATKEQRGEVVTRGANMFSSLTDHPGGLVFLDFVASAAHNWAAAVAEHNLSEEKQALETLELFASQIASIEEGLRKGAANR